MEASPAVPHHRRLQRQVQQSGLNSLSAFLKVLKDMDIDTELTNLCDGLQAATCRARFETAYAAVDREPGPIVPGDKVFDGTLLVVAEYLRDGTLAPTVREGGEILNHLVYSPQKEGPPHFR